MAAGYQSLSGFWMPWGVGAIPVEIVYPGGKPEEVLVYLLKSNEAVNDLVKGSLRICPDQLPIEWKGKTAIVYEQSSDRRIKPLVGEGGVKHTRFTLYFVDRSRATSRRLAYAARLALESHGRRVIMDHMVLQVFVPDGERDESLPGSDGADPPERYRAFDCVIHHVA